MDFPKNKAFRSSKYLAFVQQQHCSMCGIKDDTIVPHHEGDSIYGKQCSDLDAVPLCYVCHMVRTFDMSKEDFWQGVDLNEVKVNLLQRYIEENEK